MRIAINLVHIKNKSILLVKKKDTWILPGGKFERGETYKECLIRECSEESPKTRISIGKRYKDFTGKTPHKGYLLTAKCFFGELTGDIAPGAEIQKSGYFSKKQAKRLNLSDITKKILSALIEDNHL